MILRYNLGDTVTLKKGHPCGENKWEITRTGVDIKLKCLGCDRQLFMPRIDFEKRVRKIDIDGKFVSIRSYSEKINEEEKNK